ncbi:uncharacterized protein LOC134601518 [Pelobates fuscus]|uniref:uncharacterized protein LOC134601518 n=1 Tax=Pelobates fuscus TaxID=191477 RepID=UPI002FE45AA4
MVGNPVTNQTATIRIQGVTEKDGPMFCCRVILLNNKTKHIEQQWQNRHGTFLHFPNTMWLEQLDAVPALSGETITIPCHINYPPGKRNSLSQVTWKRGSRDLCSENDVIFTWRSNNAQNQPERFSLVNFPDDVSLIIKHVRFTDEGQYCCEVSARSSILTSTHGTELAVGDFNPHRSYKVLQSQDSFVELGDSVTINCSFSSSVERILWTGIYWTVGSPAGNYSYHPSQQMIRSTYRNRTSLIGKADLHIKDIQSTDSGTYYCLVMLRFCIGNNKVKSTVLHGVGTRLNVADNKVGPPLINETLGSSHMTFVISALSALLLVIILCGILIVLKKKGIICKTTKSMDNTNHQSVDSSPNKQTSTLNDNATYETIPDKRTEPAEAGGVVYAQLNKNSFNKGNETNNSENLPNQEPQVVYATVRTNK